MISVYISYISNVKRNKKVKGKRVVFFSLYVVLLNFQSVAAKKRINILKMNEMKKQKIV